MLASIIQYSQGRIFKKPLPPKEFMPKYPDWRERQRVDTSDPLQRDVYAALKGKLTALQGQQP